MIDYKQVRYRADQGRFDGSLNSMADEGWRVEHIHLFDGVYLVTYSRELDELPVRAPETREVIRTETSLHFGYGDFQRAVRARAADRWRIISMSSVLLENVMIPDHDPGDGISPRDRDSTDIVQYACVWEKTETRSA